MGQDAGGGTPTFDDELEQLGFRVQGRSRRGGRMWTLVFNRVLTFTLHDYDDAIVLTWSCDLGSYALERGWQIGASETAGQELYPQHDVRLPLDAEAVRGEVTRVLATLRLDLADPAL
jgi:hypothetical protein